MTNKHDAVFVGGLTVLMVGTWLGFLVHRSPRFAGSPFGTSLGIVGALLMLVPLLYMVVKRVRPLKRWVTRRASMGTLLTIHIYTGIAGPIFALAHTGHKFHSPLGISLTAAVLVVALSGFVGRYLNSHVTRGLRDKKELRDSIQRRVDEALAQGLHDSRGAKTVLARSAGALADVEYAIKTHELFKRWFGRWLRVHIAISLGLYALIGLHVWAAFHFTARWDGGSTG